MSWLRQFYPRKGLRFLCKPVFYHTTLLGLTLGLLLT